jgi:mannose-1-phosphate guanylyltransferase
MRLVAVFGYSPRRPEGLHGICEARVRHAEHVVSDDDAVLLSGEAELMHGSWNGHQVLLDPQARNTRENARAVAAAAEQVGAQEVVVVTSRWHAFRARTLVRAAVGPAVEVTASPVPGRAPLPLLARELACLAVLPLQLASVRLSAPRR